MPKHRIRSNRYGCTMSSFNTISAEKLARLIGTPKCPVLVDVRTDEAAAGSDATTPATHPATLPTPPAATPPVTPAPKSGG